MIDAETVQFYDERAPEVAARYREWDPMGLRRTILGFFHAGGSTADIGCGSGRDVAWLAGQGFPAVGYDASERMLAEARAYFSEQTFQCACLPELDGVASESYANVLCSGVLMHLPPEALIGAALSLARILQPGGRLVLAYRGSRGPEVREGDGRLFTDIPAGRLTLLLESAGFQVISVSRDPDARRKDMTWTVLLAEKSPLNVARGLDRIQAILAQDKKVATYKLALVRSLCEVSRTEAHLVRWGEGVVYVPLWLLAAHWLAYYWPLLTSADFVAQVRGETPTSTKPIAFRRTLVDLGNRFGRDGLWAAQRVLDERPAELAPALALIGKTIRAGPVTYAGTASSPIFRYQHRLATAVGGPPIIASLGWVVVPEPIWIDITRFEHWIEDSVVVRWASLSVEMNPAATVGTFLALLLSRIGDEHDTGEVRSLLLAAGVRLECVWTGKPIREAFHVDHVIPYSVWGNNDLWNLLPCLDRVNTQKSDALPSLGIVNARQEAIIAYWRTYREHRRDRFDFQIARALGGGGSAGWEKAAIAGLRETVQKLSVTRGLPSWAPK